MLYKNVKHNTAANMEGVQYEVSRLPSTFRSSEPLSHADEHLSSERTWETKERKIVVNGAQVCVLLREGGT